MQPRITAIAALGLGIFAAGSALAQSSSMGELMCQMDVEQVEKLFDNNRAAMSPSAQYSALNRLQVAETWCASRPALSSTPLRQARQIIREAQNQTAEVPGIAGAGDYPGGYE